MISTRLALCALPLLLAVSASALPTTYTFKGVQFNDGGTVTGTFAYDPVTNLFSNVNVTTTTGGARVGATYNFVCGQDVPACTGVVPANATQALYLTSTAANQNGNPALAIFFTGIAGINGLGTGPYFDVSGSSANVGIIQEANCANAACSVPANPSRVSTAGFVVALTNDYYQLRYLTNLDKGDSYISLTNAGTFNGFDPAGRICVNVYTFDPAEELVSCCACPVTPNGLNSLSARNDLISNTLTPGTPTSITVKLLATVPGPGGTCNPSTPTTANLVRGMRAWATTLHANTSTIAPVYQETETPFSVTELSTTELSKLTSFCGFIQSNGSGFGICKSCRTGALGSTQQ